MQISNMHHGKIAKYVSANFCAETRPQTRAERSPSRDEHLTSKKILFLISLLLSSSSSVAVAGKAGKADVGGVSSSIGVIFIIDGHHCPSRKNPFRSRILSDETKSVLSSSQFKRASCNRTRNCIGCD